MTDVTPIRVVIDGSGDTTGLSEFQSGETLGLSHGGTGATTAGSARTNLGLSAIAASGSWTDLLNKPDTDSIPEGSTNLYYADSRVQSYLTANSYTDQSYVNATVNAAVSNLLDGAPGVLDTLNELAAAIGDDANFITTITNQISAVQSNVDNLTTTNIPEGTNLYYTNERVDDRVADLIVDGVGISKSYDDAGNLLNISINFTEFDTDDIIEGSVNTFLNTRTTSDLTEGTNLYYTDERVDDRVSALITAGSNITALYNDVYGTLTLNVDNTGGFDLANNTTDDLSEGVNRLYYTTTRVYSAFDTRLATKSTTDLTEGSNLYFTNARATAVINTLNFATETYVDNADDALQLQINSNDADISTINSNITAEINRATAAENTITTNLNSEISRAQAAETVLTSDLDDEVFDRETGDADLQTQINTLTSNAYTGTNFDTDFSAKSTTDLSEGTNLYYTDVRARSSISVTGDLTYNSTTGVISTQGLASSTTDDLSEGSTNLYYTDARVRSHVESQDLDLGSNKVLFANMYSAEANLPSASTYHGMFAHVHGTGKGYFAHGGNWIKLLDESSSTTTDLNEGTNLYYTEARTDARIALQVGSSLDLSNKTTTDLAEGTNLYYTAARDTAQFNTDLATKSTTNLSEGSNLYFTNERVDDRVSDLIQAGSNVTVSYNDVNNTLTISATEDNLSNNTTDDLTEGSANLYYTEARTDARIALQVGSSLDLSNKTTTDLAEGTNLYYTAARDTAQFNTDLATKSTSNLSEGSNLYFTNARVQTKLGDVSGHIIPDTDVSYDLGSSTHKFRDLYLSGSSIILGSIELRDNGGVLEQIPVGGGTTLTYATQAYVTTQIANLVDTAPTTLDTLNELAAALGDDPNFATTITNSIATKLAISDFTSTADSWLTTKSTSDITEGTNLYYTDARVRNQLYNVATVTTSAGKFYIDGEQQVILTLQTGRTYRFDQSDASNTSHPLKFSEVSDGTHAGGGATEYTTGVTVNGTAGNAGAYVEIVVTNATPRLHYYCANHTGMGGKVGVGKEMFVERITSDTWITGPIQTTTVNVATGGSISAQLATLDFTNTTVNFSGASITGLSNSDVDLANIADNAQGVVVTGKVAAGSLDLAIGGSINGQLTTLDFRDTTVNFSGANISGLDDTVQDEVDFHLNKNNAAGSTIISDGQVLSWNATGGLQGTGDYEWVTQSGGGASVTTSSTAPTSPSDGDLWFDTDELKTYVYYNDGTSSQWVQSNPTGAIGGGGTSIEISDVAPTSPSAGDLWFDSDALKTFIYYDDGSGAQWIESSGGGSSIADTDALSEGSSNLYYTDARVDTHLNVSSATNGQTLIWNGTDYSWGTPAPGYTSSDFDTDFATKSTTDVVEGTNLYYTDARVQTKLGDVSGHIIPDTDVTYDLGSSTHKFRDLYLSGNSIILGGITLTESSGELLVTPTGGGSNNTFATETFVNTAIANLVDTAPTTLDTLNELAAALGDDANFSTTITNSIATKLALSGGTMSGDIDMANNELLNVNYITFNDPGPNEGLRWTGGNIEIFESPDDLTTNTAGNLQVTYSGTRRLSVSNTGIDVNGNITIPANATLSAGSSNKINIGNSSLNNVNKIFISDPGPNEGIEWLGGNAWQIYESPDDLVTNSGGNLQFVSGSPTSGIAPVRRMTLDIAGNLNLLTGSFIGNLAGNADTATTVSDISNHNTDDLSEGSTNLYYTESRVDARVAYAATGALSVTYTPKPIYAILKLTSNESISGATWSKLDNFTTVSTDNSPSQAISDATNSRMIIPAGVEKVRLSAGARINDVSGQVGLQIYHYDSNNNWLEQSADTSVGFMEVDSAGNDAATTATPILEVNQGDYFEVWAYGQDAGYAEVNRGTYFEMEVVEGSMLNSTVASTIELDHLSDVDTSTVAPTDGQALIWDNGNSEWKPGNVDVTSSDLDMGGNKVLFANMYATEGDLPSATTYHGMFAHVHSTGAGYFAHAGSWVKLANYSDIPSVYTDSAVDTHINTSTATANQVLSWNGTDYVWVAQSSGGGGGGASVSVSDTAPTSPSEGDLWFNSSNTKMYVYFNDGTSSQWIQSNPSGASTPITAADTAPSNPVENSMWFDSTDETLYFRYNDGTSEQWINITSGGSGGSSVTVSDSAPTSPTEGDMWFDSRYAVLLVYYGTQWVNVSGESGSSTTPSWQETTNHTASAGDKLFVDCSGGVATVTLPASPSMGDEIRIIDATGSASTNNITVARNGNNIQGVADNLTIDTDRAAFGLVYYNSTQGWLLMER